MYWSKEKERCCKFHAIQLETVHGNTVWNINSLCKQWLSSKIPHSSLFPRSNWAWMWMSLSPNRERERESTMESSFCEISWEDLNISKKKFNLTVLKIEPLIFWKWESHKSIADREWRGFVIYDLYDRFVGLLFQLIAERMKKNHFHLCTKKLKKKNKQQPIYNPIV